ncbi:MAG: aldo/keto reductase [Eubacteriaceae bacterium]
MKKRNFHELELSQLGFGLMRLPVIEGDDEGDNGRIDVAKAEVILEEAINSGVNYIDTAWPYHKGHSEEFAGNFFERTGLRDQIYLATKLPCWLCETPEDFDKYLNEQLKRLKTDHIDFYLIHAMDRPRLNKMLELGYGEFLDRAKSDGRIRYAGFSFHDDYDVFTDILDSYPFDFCQIQLNYMDQDFQAGLKGLKTASDRGLGVMIMEPLKGGQLARTPKGRLKELWDSFDTDETPASLGLKWVWSHPEVTVVLSGMGSADQVRENIKTAQTAGPGTLSEKDNRMIDRLIEFYRNSTAVPCTGCKYCIDCPQGIPIASIFKYWNEALQYGNVESSRKRYRENIAPENKADRCIQCGSCEDKCPQGISVIEKLQEAHAFLTGTGSPE